MYINLMTEENKNIYITVWLLLITSLVGLMIIVGGLTRLTDSGLSITRWDLFSGILPPLNIESWENAFALYKEIPEYKLLNSYMTLEDFKTIYWWEYIHRALGRLIGMLYFIPLIYFTFKKIIKKESLIPFYLIFILILIQGIIGWYMVKSGLTERTDVSQYRLSLHLTLAIIIFLSLLWIYLKHININKNSFSSYSKIPYHLPTFFLFIVIVQISIGAFVSGIDAGKIYQSWPLMNGNFFPDDVDSRMLFTSDIFEIPSIVQFIHRNTAYFIFLVFLFIAITVFKNKELKYLKKIVLFIFLVLVLQMVLGVITLLSDVQIIFASLHQIGSVTLAASSLILVYKNSKN